MLFSNYRELEASYKDKTAALEDELQKTATELEDEKARTIAQLRVELDNKDNELR